MRMLCCMVAVGMTCWGTALRAQSDAQPGGDAIPAPAPDPVPATIAPITDEDYEELFRRYIEASHRERPPTTTARGRGWMTDLAFDHTARRANDIVTVHVVESVAGAGAADTALAKSGSQVASLSGLNFFGLEGFVNRLGETDYEGTGTTNRTGALTAIVSARVAEVLPNGDLLLEGVREIDINGDRQMLLLTGVVRPEDIGTNNVVQSPLVGQLRIRYFGEGLIKDTVKPGWVTRILNKVF